MNIIERAASRLAEQRAGAGRQEPAATPPETPARAVPGGAEVKPAREQHPAGIPEAPAVPAAPPPPAAPAGREPPAADPDDPNLLRITEIGHGLLLSPDAERTRSAEEYRVIKRPLVVRAFEPATIPGRYPNLIMVCSSVQSEGKTFTSLNLAISIAMEMDSTVLLVDADVAKPGLSKVLGVFDHPGLIEQLADDHGDLADLLLRTDIPKLTVLPAGQRHRRSTELLASQRMRRLLDEIASRYPDRIVLFDSPPLLESTEAAVLASQMGQVVMVVESERTSQMLVKEALAQFETLDNVSLVLNKVKHNLFTDLISGKYSGYGYGYGYGYGADRDR
jgi:protein-tyrosine kinase